MLEYDGDAKEFEEIFMATFQVSYSDVFGTLNTHDLKEGGDHIPVTKDNRQVSSTSRASTTHCSGAVIQFNELIYQHNLHVTIV